MISSADFRKNPDLQKALRELLGDPLIQQALTALRLNAVPKGRTGMVEGVDHLQLLATQRAFDEGYAVALDDLERLAITPERVGELPQPFTRHGPKPA